MNFSRYSVSARLSIGFGIVTAILIAITVAGVVQLGTLNNIIKLDVDFGTAEIAQLARANGKAQGATIGLQRMVISTDLTYRANEQKLLAQRMQDYQTAIDKLQQLFQTDPTTDTKERTLLTDTSALTETVKGLQTKVTQLALANDPSAGNILATEVAPKVQQWTNLLGDFRDYEVAKSEAAAQSAHQNYANARNLLIIFAGIGLVIGVALAIAIARSILRQLGGEPTYAAEIARQISEGDLTGEIVLQSGDTTSLLATIKHMRDGLEKVVFAVRQGSENVSTASAEIAAGNHDLSSRTESQASALEQTAASMEELNGTVKQNADGARQADQLAKNASTIAIEGGQVVAQVVETMKGINDSSRKMSDIIGVIESIAFQTNILALNAAVEAARAGEQGRGFAVVASEVRSLAGRSADAAKEIKALIGSSVDRVEQGTQLVDQAGATMTNVVAAIKQVTDLVGEISAASSEQSAGVAQVGEAVTQMDQTTQQNAALVEEMAAAASSLRTQSEDLVKTVAVFKLNRLSESASFPKQTHTIPSATIIPKTKIPSAKTTPTSFKKNEPAKVAIKIEQTKKHSPNPVSAQADDDWETF